MMPALVIGFIAGLDFAHRRISNWVTYPLIVVGVATDGPVAFWLVVLTAVTLIVAEVPGGDLKGAAAMAAWVPPALWLPALLLTFAVTLGVVEGSRWYKLYHVVGTWPWLTMHAGSLTITYGCARLLYG